MSSSFASGGRGLPRKVAFFGHFGSPNPGNESTLVTIIARLRERDPDTEFVCVCTNPEVVAARDGIEAIPITNRTARIWDRDRPLARRAAMALVGIGAELAQYARAFTELQGTDALIAPGTGMLTDAFGLSSWGPYNLFKWTLMAKLRRSQVLFLSVGAGPIDSGLGRTLVKTTLSLANYRSYRDEASRGHLRAIGVRSGHDPVYPDLVFDLPDALLRDDHARTKGQRRIVGLGLMVYTPKYSARDPRPETYRTYLQSLAVFAAWLLEHDYDIRLLLGDADTSVIDGFRSALRTRTGSDHDDRVLAHPITSVQNVLTELAACDAVVATRFHNVLLALLLGKPVIAISFHHKVASLMDQMKLSEYRHDIHEMDADRLIEQFQKLEQDRAKVGPVIATGVARARTALEHQYDVVFGDSTTAAGSKGRGRRRRLTPIYLDLGERIWRRIPSRTRDLRLVRAYGAHSHSLVRRQAQREMYLGTLFLRNRPALELMRRLVDREDDGARVRIAILGCSIGVEVYSVLWTLRRNRPDLELLVDAVDISPDAVDVARRGVYGPASSEMVNASIFDALSEAERDGMFGWDGDQATIKPWLREGVSWHVGDAGDPHLIASLGSHDLVVANNFLCHMPPGDAQRCLRNLAGLARPGGYLFVTGVDLDVRTEVARNLGWEPIPALRAEIHDGDPLVRSDWPWRWWGLEPLDRGRRDWETRYTAAFRVRRRSLTAHADPSVPATSPPPLAGHAQAGT